MNRNKWADYWNQQSDPRHSINNDNFFKKVAKEMEYHLGDLQNKTILELGCGDGSLLKHLPIEAKQYTGVDFSESLLKIFSNNFPNHKVVNHGAIEFLQESNETFDIIFSFGVLQYFNETQLQELFSLQKKSLNKNGIAIHFGVPIEEQKPVFLSGQGTQNASCFKKRAFLKQIKSRYKNNIGHWHRLEALYDISSSSGFTTEIIGGMNYLYRVNLYQQV